MTSFCIDYYQDSGEGISVHNSQAEALLQNFTPFLLDPKVSPVEVIHVGNLFFFFIVLFQAFTNHSPNPNPNFLKYQSSTSKFFCFNFLFGKNFKLTEKLQA